MSQPNSILDLSEEEGSLQRFLVTYTEEGGCLSRFVVVAGDAVYSGDARCVEKPLSKKNLNDKDHLLKVSAALASAMDSACAQGARVEGDGGGTSRNATGSLLRLAVSDSAAVLTVREALRGGSSYVVLATVNVPRLDEVSGGLLMGVVRAAHSRGQEARRLEKKLGDAMREKEKLQGLLDKHTADKRNVIRRIFEPSVLVINSKKAVIATLQATLPDKWSQELLDSLSKLPAPVDSARESAASDVEGGIGRKALPAVDDGNGDEPAEDKVLSPQARSRGGSLSSPDRADNDRSGRGMSAGSPCRQVGKGKGQAQSGDGGWESGGCLSSWQQREDQDRRGGRPRRERPRRERHRRRWRHMREPLAAPPGTQEVSGEDLLRVIEGGDVSGDGSRNATQGGKHVKPLRSKRDREIEGTLGSMKRSRQEASQRPLPQGSSSSFRSKASYSAVVAYKGVFSSDDDDDDDDNGDLTCTHLNKLLGDAGGGNDAPGAGGRKGSSWKGGGGSGGFALSGRRKKKVVRETPTRGETSNRLADDRKGRGATMPPRVENPGSAAFEDSSSLPAKTKRVRSICVVPQKDPPSGSVGGDWSVDDLE